MTAAGSKVDLTMVCVDSYRHHVGDLAPVFRENKRCMSKQTHITIVERVHRQPLADLVKLANFKVKACKFFYIVGETRE